jgi:hypothetical protein
MNELHFPAVSVARARAGGLRASADRDGIRAMSVSPTLRAILADSRLPGPGEPAGRPWYADLEPDGPPVGASRHKVGRGAGRGRGG